jgi:uncharacterized protein YbjT (DUF2867 family)
MDMRVLVTGGTGTLGRLVVGRLVRAGCEVRVLSRRPRPPVPGAQFVIGDLGTGAGIEPAVAGVDAIVHCASAQRGDEQAARNLVGATGGGTPHLVFISIVGIDRVTFGYYRHKLAAEAVVAASGLPWTTLRATQFHDLLLRGARGLAKLPVVPVPAGFRVQPVDADEVAARLVELTLGDPAGRVPDLAGPQELSFADVIRIYLGATGRRRPIVPVWLPGLAAIRAGGLIPVGEHTTGERTWAQFLAGSQPPPKG